MLGTELPPLLKQRSAGKRSPELERTVSRVPKKIALQPPTAGASARTEGLKAVAEVAAHEEQKTLQIEDAEQLE